MLFYLQVSLLLVILCFRNYRSVFATFDLTIPMQRICQTYMAPESPNPMTNAFLDEFRGVLLCFSKKMEAKSRYEFLQQNQKIMIILGTIFGKKGEFVRRKKNSTHFESDCNTYKKIYNIID